MFNAIDDRLEELEARVRRLEDQRPASTSTAAHEERFWVLDGLRAHGTTSAGGDISGGSVLFAGVTRTPGAGDIVWQEEHPVRGLLAGDWSGAAVTLGALAHPVRLEIVRRLLRGEHTMRELAGIDGLGTSGQLYHHLRELQAAGLVEVRRRNDYAVPSQRVVQCLALVVGALSQTPIPAADVDAETRVS